MRRIKSLKEVTLREVNQVPLTSQFQIMYFSNQVTFSFSEHISSKVFFCKAWKYLSQSNKTNYISIPLFPFLVIVKHLQYIEM